MSALGEQKTDTGQILTEAVTRIASFGDLSNAKLGRILGLSPATISRVRSARSMLDPANKSFEAAQFLLRLFRSLDALLGSDDDAARRWLATPNLDLGTAPIERIDTMLCLIEVCDYVDAYRARV